MFSEQVSYHTINWWARELPVLSGKGQSWHGSSLTSGVLGVDRNMSWVPSYFFVMCRMAYSLDVPETSSSVSVLKPKETYSIDRWLEELSIFPRHWSRGTVNAFCCKIFPSTLGSLPGFVALMTFCISVPFPCITDNKEPLSGTHQSK